MNYKLAIIVEDYLEEIKEFSSEEARYWYAKGLSHGASLYGAGSCFGEFLPCKNEDILELYPSLREI